MRAVQRRWNPSVSLVYGSVPVLIRQIGDGGLGWRSGSGGRGFPGRGAGASSRDNSNQSLPFGVKLQRLVVAELGVCSALITA